MAKKSSLPIKDILAAFDYGAKGVWKELEDEERKQVSFWLLNRWMSSIQGTQAQQELAIFKVNEYYNKNWNVLGARHPQLQWQLLCVAGNTGRAERHEWIGFKKKAAGDTKAAKFLAKHYPNMKDDEVRLLAGISTKAEIRELAKDLGYDKKDFPV
jgi:hypothetical protein